MQIINSVTMLSIILTGAALIREAGAWHGGTSAGDASYPVRDHGCQGLGHGIGGADNHCLLADPGCQGFSGVPIEGSVTLFLVGTALHLFATTSLGIFLGTIARSMPQFGLLMMLVLLPLQILSGSATPRESMPDAVQWIMLAAPNTHFVILAQAILYRGAGLAVVWPQLISLALIGSLLFSLSLAVSDWLVLPWE